jgi:hypothetical protein
MTRPTEYDYRPTNYMLVNVFRYVDATARLIEQKIAKLVV